VGKIASKISTIVLFAIRVCVAVVLGWWLMIVPFLLGLNGWGFFHSGIFVLVLPITAAFSYWLIGLVPIFRSTRVKRVTL